MNYIEYKSLVIEDLLKRPDIKELHDQLNVLEKDTYDKSDKQITNLKFELYSHILECLYKVWQEDNNHDYKLMLSNAKKLNTNPETFILLRGKNHENIMADLCINVEDQIFISQEKDKQLKNERIAKSLPYIFNNYRQLINLITQNDAKAKSENMLNRLNKLCELSNSYNEDYFNIGIMPPTETIISLFGYKTLTRILNNEFNYFTSEQLIYFLIKYPKIFDMDNLDLLCLANDALKIYKDMNNLPDININYLKALSFEEMDAIFQRLMLIKR